jgi:hypothetical protein
MDAIIGGSSGAVDPSKHAGDPMRRLGGMDTKKVVLILAVALLATIVAKVVIGSARRRGGGSEPPSDGAVHVINT